jgi:hypothetical protein
MIDHIVAFISGIGEAIVERRDMEIMPFREAVVSQEGVRLQWSDFEDEDGT